MSARGGGQGSADEGGRTPPGRTPAGRGAHGAGAGSGPTATGRGGGCGTPGRTAEVLDLDTFRRRVLEPELPPGDTWRPMLVRLKPGERPALEALVRERRLLLFDSIERQLRDLARVRHPLRDAEAEAAREAFVRERMAGGGGGGADAGAGAGAGAGTDDAAGYGVWAFFPWDGKLVHVLERDDFREVITNRNLDKITPEERERLLGRTIGVIGLSVGGEAAVTVAQEHLCGRIVLADFDALDLSNLNRLNGGVDELGQNKAVLVARRIARIDPFLEVRIFPEGVGEANADAFLDGLDLLLEECDDLGMKHRIRELARARGLDIVFAGDERGFLSVEPYGSFPELASFHGRIDAPPLEREAYPDELAFLRALTEWLGGWEAISERSRRSLEAVGTRLCGYPQLASEARYAAGQVGHVARRLLLGERVRPFLGHLDLEKALPSMGGGEGEGETEDGRAGGRPRSSAE